MTIRYTGEFVEAGDLLHADAGDVSATRVSLEESTAKSITGDHVTMTQSAVKTIRCPDRDHDPVGRNESDVD